MNLTRNSQNLTRNSSRKKIVKKRSGSQKREMKRYRNFIVKKFGKENEPSNEEHQFSDKSADDKWRRTDDFTNVFPKKQSAQKFLDAEALSRSASKSKTKARGQSNKKRMQNNRSSQSRSFSPGCRSLSKERRLDDTQNLESIGGYDSRNMVPKYKDSMYPDKQNGPNKYDSKHKDWDEVVVPTTGILSRTEEAFFLRCFTEVILFEKDLEVQKINLSLREDFNLIDAFGMLD